MMQHLLEITDLNKAKIEALLERAQHIFQAKQHYMPQLNSLSAATVVNCFFEPSTRTHISFRLAAQRLGAQVIDFDTSRSSIEKGESLLDTFLTLQAMHCQLFVIRHAQAGIPSWLAQHANDNVAVINAGDGSHAHPSQALLDCLTVLQRKPDFSALRVVIIGDYEHTRVIRSQIAALQLLGVKQVCLIAPKNCLPDDPVALGVETETDIDVGLHDADVVITMRIQAERLQAESQQDTDTYAKQYGLSLARLRLAKPDAIVLHPGPAQRDIEISSDVLEHPACLMQQQVENGIAMRMAIMETLYKGLNL